MNPPEDGPRADGPRADGPRADGLRAGGPGADGSGDRAGLARRCAEWFGECFGAEPGGVWLAPGRVNLIGEHTDYNEGFVLPLALREGIAVAVASRDDGMLAVRTRQDPESEAVIPLDGLAPGAPMPGWAAYPAGVAWALAKAGHPVPGASIAIDSSLPAGAGLSSSAALECSVALALTRGAPGLPRPELAALARRAENDFAGVPCGIMDQSASLLCQAGHALLLDCRTLEMAQVPFDPAAAGMRLLVINTRARHELGAGEYGSRRAQCEEAARLLGVPALRDVPGLDAIASLDDPVLRRRARHVVTDNERVRAVADLLGACAGGDATAFGRTGELLTRSHRSLRDDFEVSWPEADVAVDAALEAGALGARMMGGGFGGSAIALVPAGRADAVRAAIREAYAARGWIQPEFLAAVPSDSALRLR